MVTIYKPKAAARGPKHTELVIERLDHEAQGIHRQDGVVSFISGALPAERVRVELTEQKKQYQRGHVIKVLQASPLRRPLHCASNTRCGGCQLGFVEPSEALALKTQGIVDLLTHQLKISDLPWQAPIVGDDVGYRRKARVGVWFEQKTQQFQIGFRGFQSKEIVDVPDCAVLSPAIAPAIDVLRRTLPTLSQGKAITHVELLDADGQAFVVVRHIKGLPEKDRAALCAAWPQAHWLGELEPGVLQPWREQPEPSYALADGQRLQFSANDFIQVNAQVNQQMVTQALAWLMPEKSDQVLDLYCGIGNFSMALAAKVQQVVGVEGVHSMVQRARANAELNQLDNLEFFQADLHLPWQKAPWANRHYTKILLDPARAGAEGAIEQIAARKAKQVLYVSCNATTFARDAKVLLANGYRIAKIGVMDMFPYTSHLELMALFEK
jgi:23S rRNA (uracil1939-C5)-methyltransferase